MRSFFVIIQGFIFVGCTSLFGPKTVSNWKQLESVDSISCKNWPLKPQDIGVNDVVVANGFNQTNILAESIQRNGSKLHYYYSFKGSPRIDVGDVKPLRLGADSSLVRANQSISGDLVAVIKNKSRGRSVVEFRRIKDNIVLHTTRSLGKEVYGGKIHRTDSGYWLLAQNDRYELRFVDTKVKKSPLPVRSFRKNRFSSEPSFLPMEKPDQIAVLSLDESKGSKGSRKETFYIRSFSAKGKQLKKISLPISTAQGVESWDVTYRNGSFIIAFVEGDSVIGQATLRLVRFNWQNGSPTLDGEQKIAMTDLHLSEPFWVSTPLADHLLILKWVDEESTLAAYTWKTGAELKTQHFGIFPKGSTIVDSFVFGKDFESFAVIRNRQNLRWNFKICHLDDL